MVLSSYPAKNLRFFLVFVVPRFSLLSIMVCTNVPGPISTRLLIQPDSLNIHYPLAQLHPASLATTFLVVGKKSLSLPHIVKLSSATKKTAFLCLSTFGPGFPQDWFCVGLGGKARPCTHALD